MAKKSQSEDDDDILPVKDIADVSYHKSFCIYGRSGTGKTTLSSTFPTPQLYVNVRDNGTDSTADVKGIKVYELDDLDDLEELRMWLRRNRKKIAKGLYKTLVIDTMSQLQELYVEHVADQKDKKSKKTKKPGEWGSMSKQDWGEVASEMKALIIELRNLPMNVVFIAQDRTFNFDDDGTTDEQLTPEVGPRLMPSVVSVLNAAVTVIVCTYIKQKVTKKKSKKSNKMITTMKPTYCLRVGPSSVYTTKIRKPRAIEAPEFIEDPEYDDIIDVIQGDY